MLTSDLLVTKSSKGKIEPVYAKLDQENLEISSSLIDLFQQHKGKTYGELIEEIEGIEEMDYRLIRGLTQILERRCVIEMNSVIEPATARRSVFEECKGARDKKLHHALPCATPSVWGNPTEICAGGNTGV